MRTSAVTAFVMLMVGLLALPISSTCRTDPLTPVVQAGDSLADVGLLAQVGQVESDISEAKSRLTRAGLYLAMGGDQSTSDQAAAVKPKSRAKPANMATVFEWDCPAKSSEYSLHVFSVMTDAQWIDPVIRSERRLGSIVPFGPKVTSFDEDQDGQADAVRLLEYSWTAAPGQYEVEVITLDPDTGIKRSSQLVEIAGETPQPPDPPTGGGLGLAAKVPAWLATVPSSARGNQAAIKEAMLNLASSAGSFASVSQMLAALDASLSKVISDKPAWTGFGNAWNSEITTLIAAGKITTPADYAQALREVGGAL